jgi:spermidine synthase
MRLSVAVPVHGGTLRVQATKWRSSFEVTTDATGVVGRAAFPRISRHTSTRNTASSPIWYTRVLSNSTSGTPP